MPSARVTPTRADHGLAVIGGPTVVLDIAGLRILTDPTFGPPTDYGPLRKLCGPAVSFTDIGPVDAVLVSHDLHFDNLDRAGREIALAAPLLLTNPSAADRLGGRAVACAPWAELTLPNGITVTAVPAEHGPADGERGPEGFINCEVIGFVLTDTDGRTLYISGDNASLRVVREIRERIGRIDHAVLHAGAASVATKFNGRPLSLTAERAVAAAEILGARHVVVVHQQGWAHFTQGPDRTRAAFHEAGLDQLLDTTPLGQWTTHPNA